MTVEKLRAVYDALTSCNPSISFQRGFLGEGQLGFSPLDKVVEWPYIVDGKNLDNYVFAFGLGLPDARRMLADYLGLQSPEQVIVYEQTARAVIYDILMRGYMKGFKPYPAWHTDPDGASVLLPVPGYDNHYQICEDIGLSMIPVDMRDTGPDMEQVEELIKNPRVKCMVIVPRYHNPLAVTYSPKVMRRLGRMKPAALGFRLIVDYAYGECHFTAFPDRLLNIMDECQAAGNPDMPLFAASMSKVTTPGQSIACVAGSVANMNEMAPFVRARTSNPRLIEQYKHVSFFGGKAANISKFMQETHVPYLSPKMKLVDEVLMEKMGGHSADFAWRLPDGAYSFPLKFGKPCALRVRELAGEKGVILHDPREMYPYGDDRENNKLRIMPSAVDLEDITAGMWIVCACIKLALAEYDAACAGLA